MKGTTTKEVMICPVTGEKWYTGEILVAKNTRSSVAGETVTGYGYSEEVQKYIDDGYYAFIEIDSAKTNELRATKRRVTKLDAVRTGGLLYLHNEVAKGIFGDKVEEMNFIDEETFNILKQQEKNASITEEKETTGDGKS